MDKHENKRSKKSKKEIHIHIHLQGGCCCGDENDHDHECCQESGVMVHTHVKSGAGDHVHTHGHDHEAGHVHEHEHAHGDACCEETHTHEHEHDHSHDHEGHDHTTGQAHAHDHDHEHGNEEHDHGHEGHDHSHEGHDHEHVEDLTLKPGEIILEKNTHDEATVVSGKLALYADKDEAARILAEALEKIGEDIKDLGGIIGHIKASLEAKTMDMYSVTDETNSVKSAPKQDIAINLASIVFLVTPDQVEEIMRRRTADLIALK